MGGGGGGEVGCVFFFRGGAAEGERDRESLVISPPSDLSAYVTSSLCCLHPQDWFRAALQ